MANIFSNLAIVVGIFYEYAIAVIYSQIRATLKKLLNFESLYFG